MSNYWQKRFQAVEEMNNKTAKETVRSVTPAFDKAQAQIETVKFQLTTDGGVSASAVKLFANIVRVTETIILRGGAFPCAFLQQKGGNT